MQIRKEKKKEYKYQARIKYKRKQIIIIAMIVICCFSFISILARYVTNNLSDFYFRSKEFYFYSDKLKEQGAYYQLDNWSGIDDYVITVNMNSNKNNLVFTNYDIEYEISYNCSNNIICQLSKEQGTISTSTHTDYFNLTITPNTALNSGDRVWVEIIAKSTTNYNKTLKARFTLIVGKEKLSYKIEDSSNSPYLELKLTNTLSYYYVDTPFDSYSKGNKIDIDTYMNLSEENKNKCYSSWITVEFNPSEVLLDMTNENYLNATNVESTKINQYDYIHKISFKLDALSSTNVRFYKKDISKDYTYPSGDQALIFTITNK